MKFLVRWRLEGETLIDCEDLDSAETEIDEHLRDVAVQALDLRTQKAEVEILGCTLVDRGNK
jgi:hypothetical protein